MDLPIHTIYGLAIGIIDFISEHDDKHAITEQISNIVAQIQNIIHPLLSRNITNAPLRQSLRGLQGVLTNTHKHVKMWKERRRHRLLALIYPWAVTRQLRGDREQLVEQYIVLMGAIQIVDYIKGYNLITPPPKVDRSLPQEARPKMAKGKGSEVLEFWGKCIGSESGSVKGAYLCTQLSSWMEVELNAVARQRLLLRLDNNNTGYVTLATLLDLIQNGNMKEIINIYTADPSLPLLIWIDDDILRNAPQALNARKDGITVVQIGSTSAAKTWILINREFLKKHDNPADIRFISDQVRTEFSPEGKSFRNRRAGEEMTKFIRDQGYTAPILIYTGGNRLGLTRYVETYQMVGSSNDNGAFGRYIRALGARRQSDTRWAKYGGT